MVGQRFVLLVSAHPWFELTALAASAHSAGKPYREAVSAKWHMAQPIPAQAAEMTVLDAEADAEKLASMVDFVFCAVDMKRMKFAHWRSATRGSNVLSSPTIPRTAGRRMCRWSSRS